MFLVIALALSFFAFPPLAHATLAARVSDFQGVLGNIIASVLALAGAGFVVMLIMGGFHYLNAGDNKEAAAKARSTITHALLGLVIAVSAWMILTILGNFLGILGFGAFQICIVAPC